MRPRMRHKNKYEFLIEFRSKNVRFWRCWTHRNALYISISVVFADYDKIENFMKIYAQMDPKSHPKIDIWAIRGPTFEVFGRILKNAIFWWFLGSPKIDQKSKSLACGAQTGHPVRWPCGIGGARLRLWSSAKTLKSYSTRCAPRNGGGGFKRSAHSAGPCEVAEWMAW